MIACVGPPVQGHPKISQILLTKLELKDVVLRLMDP